MPSVSKKQHNLMEAVAHSPSFAKKVGIKHSVGKDFAAADKGRKFKQGGIMKHDDIQEDKKLIKRAFGMHDKQEHAGKHTDLSKLKKGGNVKKMATGGRTAVKGEHAVQKKDKKGAEIVKMAKGGSVKASGMGSVKTNTKAPHGDGIAQRGKTRAMMPKMSGRKI